MLGDNHYVHRLRVSCLKQPQFNRHQLLALDHELTLTAKSRDLDHYLAQSHDLLELARASLLDRAANSLATAKRYDDPWVAAAAGIEYRAVLEGGSHAELYAHLLAGQQASASLRARSVEVHTCFERLFLSLLHLHTSHQRQEEVLLEMQSNFDRLCNADPQFVESRWLDRPRYRLRLPWPAAPLHDWLHSLWIIEPPHAQQMPADPSAILDSASDRWQARLEGGSLICPNAHPIEMPAAHSLAEKYLERQQLWPDALIARHWAEARDAIASATTYVGLEAICEDMEARFRMEAIWNTLWLSGLLAPLRAAATHAWMKDRESAGALEKAAATSYRLIGLGPGALLALPRVQHFITHNLTPNLTGSVDSLGAQSGEAGFDLLREAGMWHSFGNPIDFAAVLTQPDPPLQSQPVFYWNRILSQSGFPTRK